MKLLPTISFDDAIQQLRYDIFRSRVEIGWIKVKLSRVRLKRRDRIVRRQIERYCDKKRQNSATWRVIYWILE